MYHALEQAVQKLQSAVKDRDAMVAERDDTILVRHPDVLFPAPMYYGLGYLFCCVFVLCVL